MFVESYHSYRVKPVLRGHLWDKGKSGLIRHLKRGSVHMFSMSEQEKCDLLIQMTA
jgi:hypothetical protein